VSISKGGNLFGPPAFLDSYLTRVLSSLATEKHLRGLGLASFAQRAGYYLGELNAAHPFREGNGRTQREFIRELGLRAGFSVDWTNTTTEQMTEASRVSFETGKSSTLAQLILVSSSPNP
jgi:cell filamentation protein